MWPTFRTLYASGDVILTNIFCKNISDRKVFQCIPQIIFVNCKIRFNIHMNVNFQVYMFKWLQRSVLTRGSNGQEGFRLLPPIRSKVRMNKRSVEYFLIIVCEHSLLLFLFFNCIVNGR